MRWKLPAEHEDAHNLKMEKLNQFQDKIRLDETDLSILAHKSVYELVYKWIAVPIPPSTELETEKILRGAVYR